MRKRNRKVTNGPQWLTILIMSVLAVLYLMLNELPYEPTQTTVSGTMEVHFIDVGQGDSILIKSDGSNILIDGGDRSAQDKVLSYLQSQGVHTLDLMVGTHPHSDHIGGLIGVVNELSIKKIMMPKAETTTETFRRLLLAIEDKGLKISSPAAGESFDIGSIEFLTVAPNNEEYKDLNNTSIVLKASYGNVSFLFTGDAESLSENEILDMGYNISSRVLKVGHHGSNSSTNEDFLDAVNPSIAVISCAEGNTYGHPHREVMERLNAKDLEILRTDELGDIVIITDGNTINIE